MNQKRIKLIFKLSGFILILLSFTALTYSVGLINGENRAINIYKYSKIKETKAAFAEYDDPQKNTDGTAIIIIDFVCGNDPTEGICDELSYYYSKIGYNCVAMEWQLGAINAFRKNLKNSYHESDDEIAKNNLLKIKAGLYNNYMGLCQTEKQDKN